MSIASTLAKLRDQAPLQKEEIDEFLRGLANGDVSDAQAAAFAMAVCLNGLSDEERVNLTLGMRDTGNIQKWNLPGPVIDKHSTGGIGDNTSLALAPMLAACGAYVPMVSGRGLGHTGGTLDKLESIPGYRTQVTGEELELVVKEVGCAIVGAGEGIAPADKRLYAIRDLTGTVESVDLITASILSKKLAVGLESLVLDVKVGSGSFMKDIESARVLAQSLVTVGNGAGCKTMALLTDMNEPLANAAGNALEVKSALKLLRNEPGEERLLEVVLSLGAPLLAQTGLAEDELSGRVKLEKSLENGRAAEIFGHMVHRLGGPGDFMDYSDRYLRNAIEVDALPSPVSGYLEEVDGQLLGQAVIELGGGRKRMDDILDLSVGLDQFVRIGEKVNEGDPLLRIHAATGSQVEAVKILLAQAFKFSTQEVVPKDLLRETVCYK